jgi:hypothetical protein
MKSDIYYVRKNQTPNPIVSQINLTKTYILFLFLIYFNIILSSLLKSLNLKKMCTLEMILTMVYDLRDYLLFGLCPSSF